MSFGCTATVLVALVLLTGCQDNIKTPIPEGLEPFLDDDMAAAIDLPSSEGLTLVDGKLKSEIRIWGRGLVEASPAAVWAAELQPEVMLSRCQTDKATITVNPTPAYDLDFDVSYEVDDILTVQWLDRWHGDVVDGDAAAPELAMVKHQKVEGSDFITTSEGTIRLVATSHANETELQFVEHLQAVSGGADQVHSGVQDNFDAIVAVAHGDAIPPCP